MPPKNKFPKEKIIETAFEIGREEGIDNITIRKIAEKMGSSIAPIYVNFKDIDELKQAVINKIFHVSKQMATEQNTGSPFRDIGIASLRFAMEYSVFFRDMVLGNNDYLEGYDQEVGNLLIEQMQKDPQLEGFTVKELGDILLKMRIFQLGLSVMVANRLLPENFSEEKLIAILDSSATDVVVSARMRKDGSLKDL